MSTNSKSPPSENSRRSRLRWWHLPVTLVLALGVVYFVVGSQPFVKGFILPKVAKSMNATITAGDLSLSPFSSIAFKSLSVTTTGPDPLFQAAELRIRYNLWSFLTGTWKLNEFTAITPVIHIVQNPDGTSNLDPLLAGEAEEEPDKSLRLDIRNLTIRDGTARITSLLPNGGRTVNEISKLNATLDQLANGKPGKLSLDSDLAMNDPANGSLKASSAGSIEFAVDDDLLPKTAKGASKLTVTSATGRLAELANLVATLDCELTPAELKPSGLSFERSGRALGSIRISGPYDSAKREGSLKIEISGIDRNALNLLGAPMGVDFGGTTLSGNSQITLAGEGRQITANGKLAASRFSATLNGTATPIVDLNLGFDLGLDQKAETFRLQTLTLNGTQNGQAFLQAALTQPMLLNWGGGQGTPADSAIEATLKDFNLAEWKAILGDAVQSGRLNALLKIGARQSGRQLQIDLDSRIENLAMTLGEQPFTQGRLSTVLRGQVEDFKKVTLSECKLELLRQDKKALSVNATAKYDGAAFTARGGTEFVPLSLTGTGPSTPVRLDLDLDGLHRNNVIDLKKLLLTLSATRLAPKNELLASGQVDLSNPAMTKSRISLRSESLDLTPLYDTFAQGSPAPASTPAPAPTTPPVTTEPEPVQIPLDLALDVDVAKAFLREIVVSSFKSRIVIANNRVLIDPFSFTLNNAPVSAKVDLNLGVKGYAYDLVLKGQGLQLEPLANSFAPESKGQYKGLIVADASIKGAGLTGASLKQSLNGRIDLLLTNANLQLVGPRAKSMLTPIALALRSDALLKSPVDWMAGRIDLGKGAIDLKTLAVQSRAFEARTKGAIPIANVLNQSVLSLPVDFSLQRSLAQSSNLMPPNAPTNTPYVELPRFVSVAGTLGQPQTVTDKAVLAGLLVKSGLGIAEGLGLKVDDKAGGLLQGVGNLLTGQKPAGTNNASTNSPASTNKPAAINPLDLLQRRKPQ